MPVINVPAFEGEHGMPIGVSLVAGRFRDQHLLGIGKLLSGPLMAKGGWYGKDVLRNLQIWTAMVSLSCKHPFLTSRQRRNLHFW